MKKRKKYLVTAENSEAFACSLVSEPAVEELFVAFNEQKELKEKFADEKKHMVTGVVAIPNKPIFRRDPNGEEYDIVFSAEAIESMAKKFMKDFRQKNVTLQHQEDADGIYMVEQWIKADEQFDKSLSLGFSKDIPVGTWFQTYYVDSNDVWQRITSGELRGFSLECALGVEEFEKQIFESQETVTEPVVETPTVEEVVETQTVETPTVDEPREKGILAKILELINGKPIEDVSKAEEPVVEEPKVEEELEPTVEPEPQTEPEPQVEPQPNPLEEVVKNLQEEIKALKENNSSLLEQIREMGKKPSVEPSNLNPKGNGNDTASNLSNWLDKMEEMIG